MSGVAASAMLTSKSRPNTWFIATNEAAMPAAVWKKRRRDKPCRRASRSLSSLSRASTSRCLALCGAGMYSSLDTIWVGTGDGNDAVSAGWSSLSCSSVRNFTLTSLAYPHSATPAKAGAHFSHGSRPSPGMTRRAVSRISLARGRWDFEVQQSGCVATEDRPPLGVLEPRCAFDHADWVGLAHIGRIVGAHQDVVGAILVDEIVELVVSVDEGIEIDPLEIGGRHPMQLLAAIRAGRRGVIDATRISGEETAAMGDDELEIGVIAQHPAEDQMMQRHGRVERVADHIGEVVVGEASGLSEPVGMHENHET